MCIRDRYNGAWKPWTRWNRKNPFGTVGGSRAVSYTHLDVYKRQVEMYNSTPALTLPSISEPTVPITKAGPALMQKRQALCASFSVIAFFLSNSYVIFAPMGNPVSYTHLFLPRLQLMLPTRQPRSSLPLTMQSMTRLLLISLRQTLMTLFIL